MGQQLGAPATSVPLAFAMADPPHTDVASLNLGPISDAAEPFVS